MRICIFCSASETLEQKFYDSGKRFGTLLGEAGLEIVFGGYHEGLMGTVANAASEAGAKVTAVVPDCFNWEGYAFEGCAQILHTDSIRNRKAKMEQLSDGFAVLPGGIGTMDEFFDVLVQISMSEKPKPVAVLNIDGIYDNLENLLKTMAESGFLSKEKHSLVRFFSEEAEMVQYF